ncbi:hypothetical protein Gotur_027973 [Gossypium turneri]
MSTSDNNEDGDACSVDGRNSKKVRFKGKEGNNVEMLVGPMSSPSVSWKDLLLRNFAKSTEKAGGKNKEHFNLEERDFSMTIVNGILAIDFSDRVKNYLLKDIETTVMVKLLGQSSGYITLQNRVSSLWQPSKDQFFWPVEKHFYTQKCFWVKSNEEQSSFGASRPNFLKYFWLDEKAEIFCFSGQKVLLTYSFTFLACYTQTGSLLSSLLSSLLHCSSAASLILCWCWFFVPLLVISSSAGAGSLFLYSITNCKLHYKPAF